MLPIKLLDSPIVALDPIAQKTFFVFASFLRVNEVAVAVVKALPTWKIHCASALPPASRVTVPAENSIELAEQYTPGERVSPVRSAKVFPAGHTWAANMLYVV